MNAINLLAYIDPMSGAVVLQLIIAFVAGTAAYFRHTILGGFKRFFVKPQGKADSHLNQ
jgi:hypothetical protein